MSKEQINYLLALATLAVVWLYFNTYSANTNRNCGPGPRGEKMFGPGRSQNPMRMRNMPQSSEGNEFSKNQVQRMQKSEVPGATLFPPSEVPQKDADSES